MLCLSFALGVQGYEAGTLWKQVELTFGCTLRDSAYALYWRQAE